MKTWLNKNVSSLGLVEALNVVLSHALYVLAGLWIADHL
jgi:hypothetical protein